MDDHENDPGSSTALVVGGLPVDGTTEIAGGLDFFSFGALEDIFYDLETFDLGVGSDTLLALLSPPDGQKVLAGDDQGGREFNASRIIF